MKIIFGALTICFMIFYLILVSVILLSLLFLNMIWLLALNSIIFGIIGLASGTYLIYLYDWFDCIISNPKDIIVIVKKCNEKYFKV